ncbi:MAG: IS21 family transposase [Bradymonadales bacterium]|nr:IS21 family transposase [Bradymonadales bacterium]
MSTHRLTMRKTREILRLKWGLGRSGREVARSLGISPATVGDCILRAKLAGLSWPLNDDLDDGQLEAMLYPPPKGKRRELAPDWPTIFRELKRKGVTLALLWQEYKAAQPEGYQYSQFCELYRRWRKKLDVVMRQEHRAGEKMFVDYAGPTVEIVDPNTGEVKEAVIFVAALGASNYTYAEAQGSQELKSWIEGNIRALEFFKGVPEIAIPDNLKSGVTKPCFYEPDINPSYHEMATHFGMVVIPARRREPRDKAKVENAVLQVERWVLAPLRNQTFFSLAELNQAIWKQIEWLNNRPLAEIAGSRKSLYEELDRPALKPLPVTRYEIAEWKTGVGVNIDYHVVFDGHYYSVPYQLVQERVDIRATWRTVEVIYKGKRVASHARSTARGRYTTLDRRRQHDARGNLQQTQPDANARSLSGIPRTTR